MQQYSRSHHDAYYPGYPTPAGLYDPRFEHDACGAGFICHINGHRSHEVIHKALEILLRLTHRGAAGHDGESGDGAGILIQIPHRFLTAACEKTGITLPGERDYATGLVFMPEDQLERAACMHAFEQSIAEEGQVFLGWRTVPVDETVLGATARSKMPAILQVFIGRGEDVDSEQEFERKLFVIRKVMENRIRNGDLRHKHEFYIPSLSCRTMVYKGLLLPEQIEPFYLDLQDESFESALALVHQRYSTNTFPAWSLAQPFRVLCHNGEINTLRGNVNWLRTRESLFASPRFGDDMAKIFPVATPGGSDSAILDNALELLYHSGRSLPHAISMLIPEAWEHHQTMADDRRAFYEYHACLMEPWDGPAFVPFTDGDTIGALLDRNGLRPARYTITKNGYVIMASETGVIDIRPENVACKGRLEPGRMFLVDLRAGRIIEDDEIKRGLASRNPYREWLDRNQINFDDLAHPGKVPGTDFETLLQRQQLFGYTVEDLKLIIAPMAKDGKEPIGSMGDDTPLAVLSQRPRLLYDYFKQLFAQVTNPPLDAIREALVTSLGLSIGRDQDLFHETPAHCRLFKLAQPILTNRRLAQIRHRMAADIQAETLAMRYPVDSGAAGLRQALDDLCRDAASLVARGAAIIILSDRMSDAAHAPLPAALATAAVHNSLIDARLRTRCGLVVESAEPREIHHFCVLLGYGASAINPYLAFETLHDLLERQLLTSIDLNTAIQRYIEAVGKGILKVMSKMGISTLQSYQGAQIFEAIGIGDAVINAYFPGTPSRIGGIGLEAIHADIVARHRRAYPERRTAGNGELDLGGTYQWRRSGERHHWHPLGIARLQQAVNERDPANYREFADLVNRRNREAGTLRGLLDFNMDQCAPVPLDEVESWQTLVKRFKTGAMSYGSISGEAHETIAIAMNRIGGKSNSGEGGEDAERYEKAPNGDWRRSAIKQVASGRFGVTSHYLVNADEIQIKMAQGAKPGEGGQLPAFKVYPWIAKTRHSTPYVGLISPPPHHDIYSIEDLAQLIYDLKNANPNARINVKLVSQAGVGTVAAGVAKGRGDVVLISGHDGGTGATPLTSQKNAGLPWELGIAEAHQTLVRNNLRNRIVVEVDGQLKTGRDVAIAALLGAEEFGFSTAPLIAMGCIMMRVCHLNTCPVGIATQDPELRAKFKGQPEQVINYFYLVAQELREIMARLGFRTLDQMVGQVSCLKMDNGSVREKAAGIDLSRLLAPVPSKTGATLYCSRVQDHELANVPDRALIKQADAALSRGKKVQIEMPIRNVYRAFGTMLSSEISRRYGAKGLPDDTIRIECLGSAGQSFAAFGAPGITFHVRGDANDYFGKGLSGARLVISPPDGSTYTPEANVIIGNVAFYGATGGEGYIRGMAGERFCVRNSGVQAVVEGVGDHGCEYMTGGRVVVLGRTGRNFAAGMSGGVAYVLDEERRFQEQGCNLDMVDLEAVIQATDIAELREMIENHLLFTDSAVARCILNYWDEYLPRFVMVMPREYKRALEGRTSSRDAVAAGKWDFKKRA